MGLSRLNGWPARSPADASPLASRPDTHGSGPTWIATPSSYRTLTDYSWPVSRRTTHSLVASQGSSCRSQTAKAQPRPDQALDAPMILLDDVVEVIDLAQAREA